jgi:hypothetical protein
MRVFISSTCYDLIDIRAELEECFKTAGVQPILSDSLDSDFQVSPDANSIETCLANVRSCECFVIVLSGRYGPRLKKASYGDVSATHLEYLEARERKLPIWMYVRDRLEADYAIWKANRFSPELELSWCKDPKDRPILELLHDHRALSEREGSNWFWTFRNSVDLKRRIRQDFQETFANVAIRELFNAGKLPLIEFELVVRGYSEGQIHLAVTFRNLTEVLAISPTFEVMNTVSRWSMMTLQPRSSTDHRFHWALPQGSRISLETRFTYSTTQGYMFADEGILSLDSNRVGGVSSFRAEYTLKHRRYLGASDAALLKMPSPE